MIQKRSFVVFATLVAVLTFAIAASVPAMAAPAGKETGKQIFDHQPKKSLPGAKKSIAPPPKKMPMGKININRADKKALMQLPGIGPKTADSIIAHLKKHGRIKHPEELLKVKGLGKKTLEKIKPHITF